MTDLINFQESDHTEIQETLRRQWLASADAEFAVTTRFTKESYDRIAHVAERLGVSIEQFIENAALKEAKR